jgi:proline-specific peptidase
MSLPQDPHPRTNYQVSGEGFPLILIHGVGLDRTMWEKQVEHFSTHYKVISYDMMGHGTSFKPTGSYTLQQFVDQLDNLMQVLDIEKAHLIGFSMGGLVAQAFTAQHPDRISSLVVVSSVTKRSVEQRSAILARVVEVEKHGHTSTIDSAIHRWFDPTFISEYQEVVLRIKERLENNDSSAYLAAYTVFATADEEVYDLLDKIQCPAFIITGELDPGSTPDMAKLMGERIPDSQVLIIPNTRHMLPIEAAAEFNRRLLSFLRVVDKREGADSD